jgi:hypothetical protein
MGQRCHFNQHLSDVLERCVTSIGFERAKFSYLPQRFPQLNDLVGSIKCVLTFFLGTAGR